MARKTGKTLLWTAVAIAMLCLSAWLHLATPLARRAARDWIAGLASSEIRGQLAIGSLERLSPWRIEATDVVVRDADGRVVIVGRRLTLLPDLDALLQGDVRFRRALLDGATATLIDDGDGLPTLLGSFDAPDAATVEDETPATEVVVDGIQIRDLTLRGALLGLEGIEAVDVRARGSMVIGDDVRVHVEGADGRMIRPFPFPVRIEKLSGTISTVSTEGVSLEAVASRDGERASAHIGFASPEGDPEGPGRLKIELEATRLSPETLKGVGFEWSEPIAARVTGSLHLEGPPEALALDARIESDAGPAHVAGTISEETGVRVRIESAGLALDRAFREAPALRAAGAVELSSEGDEPLRIRAEVEPFLFGEMAVPSFELEGTFEEGHFRVERMRSRHGQLDAGGTVHPDGSVEMRVSARIPDIGRDPNLERFVPNARGRLHADVRVITRPGDGRMRFRGRLVLTHVRYGLLSARRLVIEGSAFGDPDMPQLDLDVDGKDVRVGIYPLGNARLSVAGGPRYYRAKGQLLRGGRRAFDLDAQVESDRKHLTIDAETLELDVGEATWRGTLEGLTIEHGESVKLELLRLANRSQRLEAHGIVRLEGEDRIEAQLQNFDLAALRALVGDALYLREGRTDTHLAISGDLARPQILLQGALREGVVLDVRDVNALYFASYDSGQLELDAEVDLGERGLLRATGSGFVDPAMTGTPLQAAMLGSYRMELSAHMLDLSLWPAVAETDFGGKLSASMRLYGTLASPELAGDVELTPLTHPQWDPLLVAGNVQYGGRRLGVGLSIADERSTFLLADGHMDLDWGSFMRDPRGSIEAALASGWAVAGQTLSRRLDAWPRPISALAPLPLVLETSFRVRRMNDETLGEIGFDARWDQPLGSEICASGVKAGAKGTAVLEDGQTQISGALVADAERLASIDVTVDTPVDEWLATGYRPPASVRASSRIDVKEIGTVPWLCEYGDGHLFGELEMDRSEGASPLLALTLDSTVVPKRPRVGIRLEEEELICEADPLRLRLDLSADARRILGTAKLNGCGGGLARLRARIPVGWEPDEPAPIPTRDRLTQIYLDLDGSQVGPFLHQIPGVLSGEGLAHGKVGLVGPIDALRSEGRVELGDGRLYLVATGQQLTDVSAKVDFRGDWAKVEQLTARDRDGEIEIKGGIGFDNVRPSRLRLATNLRSFPVRSEGAAMAWLTGSAVLETDVGRERTRTAVKIHDLEIQLPDKVNRRLQPLEPHPDVVVTTADEPLVEPGHPLEFHIEGTRSIRVRRNDLEAELATELAVTYIDPDMRVAGYVEFRRGQFEVQGKTFRINRGSLRFDGSKEMNPDVNLVATHDVPGGSSVQVTITGTFAEPQIDFSSQACPGEGEALAYLLWGRCLADDPGAAEESAQAEGALATDILSAVGGAFIGLLGLEGEYHGITPRLGVEQGEGSEARVKAGILTDSLIPQFMRRLVQRIYVQGAVSTGRGGDFEQVDEEATGTSLDFLIELYFPHNIIGSGRFAENSWGVDLIWEP